MRHLCQIIIPISLCPILNDSDRISLHPLNLNSSWKDVPFPNWCWIFPWSLGNFFSRLCMCLTMQVPCEVTQKSVTTQVPTIYFIINRSSRCYLEPSCQRPGDTWPTNKKYQELQEIQKPNKKIIPLQSIHIKDDTPPKFNMEPENDGFQMDFPFPGTYFSGSMLNFGGVLFGLKKHPTAKQNVTLTHWKAWVKSRSQKILRCEETNALGLHPISREFSKWLLSGL